MANINHAIHSPGSSWFAFIYIDGNGKSVVKGSTKYARVMHNAELGEKFNIHENFPENTFFFI